MSQTDNRMATNTELYLTIMLPAYLEEENLRILLPRIHETGRKLKIPYEVLVVDTLEPLDHTQEVCREFGARYVRRRGGNTFGDAARTGIQEAQGKYLVWMDADGSHPPEFIEELFAQHRDHEIVIASRYIKGGYTENSASLVWMSRILNIMYAVVLGLRYQDISNSFKIYKTALLKELHLTCQNFDIIEEILYKITRFHPDVRVKEIPFSFKKRMFGDTKRNLLVFVITFLFTILRLRFSIGSKKTQPALLDQEEKSAHPAPVLKPESKSR